jgi:hypothetical protein
MLEKAVLQRTCKKRAAYSGDMQCYCVYVVVFPSRAHVVGDCQDCMEDAGLRRVQCWAESVGDSQRSCRTSDDCNSTYICRRCRHNDLDFRVAAAYRSHLDREGGTVVRDRLVGYPQQFL